VHFVAASYTVFSLLAIVARCCWQVSTALGTETPLPQAHEALDPSGRLTNTSAASADALYRGIFSRLNATLGSDLSYYWFWSPEG